MMDQWKDQLKQMAGVGYYMDKVDGAGKKEDAGQLKEVVVIGPRN
jgi:hypothetical protein